MRNDRWTDGVYHNIRQEFIMKFNIETWFDAVKNNRTDIVQRFLENKFDVETRDKTQRTALHVAACNNALDVAKFLLMKTSADIEAQMSDQGTPIMDAVACNHVQMVMLLLQYRANAAAQDINEWTLMHWIADEDCLELVDLIYNHKKNLLVAKRWNGIAPLHMVRSATMAEKLITLGSPVYDITSEYGSTPLIEAVEQDQIEVALCLIKHGANILHENFRKESAFTIAKQRNQILYKLLVKIVTPAYDKKGHRRRDKKSPFEKNITMALSAPQRGVNEKLIEIHASRRIDLFFYLLIAYYNTKLIINIEETHIQHGEGKKKQKHSAACHSAILTSLWDTLHQSPAGSTASVKSYQTSILNDTHFENSLNSTVELDESVNYFDTNYIEGRSQTNLKMRAKAIDILNKVSLGQLDPIEGTNRFLDEMHENFLSIENAYFNAPELKTSPKLTRPAIFNAQYKGTFFNACGFSRSQDAPEKPILQDDYIHMLLSSSKTQRAHFEQSFFNNRKKRIEAYNTIKQEMKLPVQYQNILV